MEDAGLDVVVATSKHNVRYLLGQYSDFFMHFDALGVDRFVPAFGYPRERPDAAFSVASELETWRHEVDPPWVSRVVDRCQTSLETADAVAGLLGGNGATVGVELSFLPERMHARLAELLPRATFVDAAPVLEELRAVKRPEELEELRVAAERIVESMVAASRSVEPGTT